jgi:hypothetical protein
MVYPTSFAQSFTFITYEGVPKGRTSLYYYFGVLLFSFNLSLVSLDIEGIIY